ncbi:MULTISPECIES: alpha/beta fold hydrolase [unclassified Schlesneria]|uniref:alpha/beta fold hydrolase n=1 Tax=Schlesneria TaxID=656899 RepID=UPI002F0337BD
MSDLKTTFTSGSKFPAAGDAVSASSKTAGLHPYPDSRSPDADPRIDGAGEPCPAPLMWQEILEKYHSESTPWQFDHGRHRILGRTWGSGPPLYFLNHFAGTAELFALTLWLLKDEFRCVVFDVTATHPKKSSRSTITDFAADLFAVANEQGDSRVSIYGAGFGAAVAMEAALHSPASIEHLFLQHGFAYRRLSYFERALASVCLQSSRNLNDLPQRRRFQAVNHQPWFPPFDSSRFEFLLESTGTIPLRDLAEKAFAAHSYDIRSRLSEISAPALLLRTEGEGRIAAEAQDVLTEKLLNCRTEWMHSAGQHPYLTHPHRVAKLVRMFVATALPQSGGI